MKSILVPSLAGRRRNLVGLVVLLGALSLSSGCANLNPVRDFAKEAESLGSHRAVPQDFVNTNVRLQALYGREESAEQLAPFKDYKKLFEERQAVLVKYMGALAALADNDVITYKKNLDEVAASATKAGVLEKADADLFAGAANLIAKFATDAARRRLIRDIVTRCDPAIQHLTEAMAETVNLDYGASLKREHQAIDSLLQDIDASKNLGLSRLAKYTMRDHRLALDQRQVSAQAFAKALQKIAAAHHRLSEHIGDFTSKEFIAELKGYQDEIKELHNRVKG